MDNVTVVIPSYKNPKCLDVCLNAALENRTDPNNQIIVVIDGFYEMSKDVLEKYKGRGFFVVDNGNNRGMQYSQNVGVMMAETEYVCIINDDNVFGKDWDTRMLSEMRRLEKEFGDKVVLTPNQVEPPIGGYSMFNFPVLDLGRTPETFKYTEWLNVEPSYNKEEFTTDGQIYPFTMRKKWYLAVGGFDTFYDSPNICDWDFFLKLELLGFTFKRTHNMHIYHFGSVATKKNVDTPIFTEKERRAFATYEYKWGTKPYNKPNENSKVPPDRKFRGFSA